jgi:hypothetical protein
MFSLVVTMITAVGTGRVLGLGAYHVLEGDMSVGRAARRHGLHRVDVQAAREDQLDVQLAASSSSSACRAAIR